MDTLNNHRQLVEALCRQVREQVAALEPLADVFAQEAKRLFRHDQVRCLRSLKTRVLSEVGNIQRMETAASHGFTTATLITGMAKLAFGGLVAAAVRNRRVLDIGVDLAERDFTRTQPFGTVVVAVGRGGLPDDVEAVSLSRLARELHRLESDIKATLQANGYLLMTPEVFFRALTELERRVLDGSLSLPVTGEQLSGKLASH